MEATVTLEVTFGTLAILRSVNCYALWMGVVFPHPSAILFTLPSVFTVFSAEVSYFFW